MGMAQSSKAMQKQTKPNLKYTQLIPPAGYWILKPLGSTGTNKLAPSFIYLELS